MFSGWNMVHALPPPPAAPPPVITLNAANPITDDWDFDGTVTDSGQPVAGLKVQFGGVLAKYHLSATVGDPPMEPTTSARYLTIFPGYGNGPDPQCGRQGLQRGHDAHRRSGSPGRAAAERLRRGRRPGDTIATVPARPATRATAERPPRPR